MAAPQGHVHINFHICKGCGLCTVACPFGVLSLTGAIVNLKGYQPPSLEWKEKCTGCGNCVEMCPDFALTVTRTGDAGKHHG